MVEFLKKREVVGEGAWALGGRLRRAFSGSPRGDEEDALRKELDVELKSLILAQIERWRHA